MALAFPNLCGLLAENPTRLSQAMHNAGFKALGLEYFYVAFPVRDTELAMRAMRELGIRGYSLTIPHKERAIAFVDDLSPDAKAVGAINTVINSGERLAGDNTDIIGIREALEEVKFELAGKRVLVLGAGGAAAAACYVASQAADTQLIVVNRTHAKALTLAERFGGAARQLSEIKLNEVDLVIHSTPAGSPAHREAEVGIDVNQLNSDCVVFDMVTNDTRLLANARTRGLTTIPGGRMLLFQALRQFELFTGSHAPREVMEEALQAELNRATSP